MNSDYKVGDLIYDANIYDAMNTNLDDWYFYKRWLPENKDARISLLKSLSSLNDNFFTSAGE